MRLLVYEIIRQTDKITVSGVTAIGRIKGIWEGKAAPVIDTAYHVELGIDRLTELSAGPSAPPAPTVSTSGDIVTFQGVCEAMDDDVYFVRFDTDWLDMIDISEFTLPKEEGDLIFFSANCYDIKIYPYTL